MPSANIPGSGTSLHPNGLASATFPFPFGLSLSKPCPFHDSEVESSPSTGSGRTGVEFLRDADIDAAPLEAKRVAILGYGNQGRAQALNLHDSGVDVVVGLRGGSGSANEAEAAGLETALIENAVASADVVMMLAPDKSPAGWYREINPTRGKAPALGFSHGLSILFGFVEPRADLDVFL